MASVARQDAPGSIPTLRTQNSVLSRTESQQAGSGRKCGETDTEKGARYCFGETCTSLTPLGPRQKLCRECKKAADRARKRQLYRRWMKDPAFVERERAQSRARWWRLRQDPKYLKARRDAKRARYRNDPEFRRFRLDYLIAWRKKNVPPAKQCPAILANGKRCSRMTRKSGCGWHKAKQGSVKTKSVAS